MRFNVFHGVGFIVAFLVLAVIFIRHEPHILLLQDQLGLVLELIHSHILRHFLHLRHFLVISKCLFHVLSEGVHINRLVVVLIVNVLLARCANAIYRYFIVRVHPVLLLLLFDLVLHYSSFAYDIFYNF